MALQSNAPAVPSSARGVSRRPVVVLPRGMRIAEAAAYMGVSPWFVELKIRSGELPALKLCRHYTLLREDLDEYLDAQRRDLLRQQERAA
jgi:excisionase family DNA binding protein